LRSIVIEMQHCNDCQSSSNNHVQTLSGALADLQRLTLTVCSKGILSHVRVTLLYELRIREFQRVIKYD